MHEYITPVKLNGFMKLGDCDYEDETGAYHQQPVPEGFLLADYVAWNSSKEEVSNLVQSLPENGRFRVLIQEVISE